MEVLKTNRQRQAIAEATTCVVMEALKKNRETDNMESRNLHGYGNTEDKQREIEIIWKATTYTVMEVLKTDRETDTMGSNNLRGYGSTEDRQRDR